MLIRYRWWKQSCLQDGTMNHAISCPGQPDGKAVFSYANEGICDIKNKRGVEYLLKTPYNYEIAYEKYGIAWDSEGREIEWTPPQSSMLTSGTEGFSNIRYTAITGGHATFGTGQTANESVAQVVIEPEAPKKRGRPKRG